MAPPLNLYWLHFVSLAPALIVLSRLEGRRAWLGGWLYGSAANAAIFWWLMPTIERFTNLGLVGGVGVLALFSLLFGLHGAVFGWGASAVRRASGSLWPLGLAAWFVACEYLNPQLFPYSQAMTLYQVPRLFLLSAFTGVTGVTFGLLAVNALLGAALETAMGIEDREVALRTLRRAGVVIAALSLGSLGYTNVRQGQIDEAVAQAETRRFALIQTNVDVPQLRAMRKKDKRAPEADLVALTREALAYDEGIDIVMWPEGAVRGSLQAERRKDMLDLAREFDVAIWAGIVERRGPKGARTRHNGAYRIAPDGTLSEPYDKNILVPFGEFMPLAERLPFLKTIRNFPTVMPGERPRILRGPSAPPAGFLVCYEITRFRYVQQQVRSGAQLLSAVTFDGWFGDTSGLDLHMMMAASMSAAMGLPQVRVATTGISMAAGPDGKLLAFTKRNERTWMAVDVPMAALPSPYARWGDWFAWLCVLSGFALAVVQRRRDLAVPLTFLGAATLTWAIDSWVPLADVAVWAGAVWLVFMAQRPK